MKTSLYGVALAFIMSQHAHAGCQDPWKPLVTEEAGIGIGGVSVNAYAEGSKLCIVDASNCPACKDGWEHECMAGGSWRAYDRCRPSDVDAIRVKLKGPSPNPGIFRGPEGTALARGPTNQAPSASPSAFAGSANPGIDTVECKSIRDQATTSLTQSREALPLFRSSSPEAGNMQQTKVEMWAAIASASCQDLLRAWPTLQKLYNVDTSPQGLARLQQELSSLPPSVREPVIRQVNAIRQLMGL